MLGELGLLLSLAQSRGRRDKRLLSQTLAALQGGLPVSQGCDRPRGEFSSVPGL